MKKSKPIKIIDEILNKIDLITHRMDLFREFSGEQKKEDIEIEIRKLVFDLYQISEIENHYFLDCSLSVYENTYQERLDYYLSDNKDGREYQFLINEIEELINPTYKIKKESIYGLRSYCDNISFNTSFNAKKEFIRNKLRSNGWICTLKPELFRIPPTNRGYESPIEIIFTQDLNYIPKVETEKIKWLGKKLKLKVSITRHLRVFNKNKKLTTNN